MLNRTPKIGILGGIGPEATGHFYLAVISKYQELGLIESNTDFPQILLNSTPAPELLSEHISDGDLAPYLRALHELEECRVDFIVMICNTIHLFYDRLREHISTPIIDLRDEVRRELGRKKVERVTILGTPSTIARSLYEFAGITSFRPTEMDLLRLRRAIFDFNRGLEKTKQIQIVSDIARRHLELGAQFIIPACTELSVMLRPQNIPQIDPMDVLVEATVAHSERLSSY